jgi:hypothetical protein
MIFWKKVSKIKIYILVAQNTRTIWKFDFFLKYIFLKYIFLIFNFNFKFKFNFVLILKFEIWNFGHFFQKHHISVSVLTDQLLKKKIIGKEPHNFLVLPI